MTLNPRLDFGMAGIALSLFCSCAFLGANDTSASDTSANDAAVASIGKAVISREDLSARTAAKLDAQKHDYDSRLLQLKRSFEQDRQAYLQQELSALVDERVLALEAAARKSTSAALTASVKPPDVTDAEVKALYDSNQKQIGQPYDQIAPKIREYLKAQAKASAQRQYLDALRTKYHAIIMLEPLRESVAPTGPQRGPDHVPVTIIEFSDFQCPFCARFAPVMRAILAKYPTQVRLIYRHLPLTSLHPQAQKAAEAAVCAQDQGKFWEMHDLLFAEQSVLDINGLKDKAKRLALDTKAFSDCLDSGKSAKAVKIDAQTGEQLGIVGTPVSYINGRLVTGARSAKEISEVIDDELRRVAPAARR